MTYLLSNDAVRVLSALRKVCRSGRARVSSILPRLGSMLGMDQFTLDEALRDLYRAGLVVYESDGRGLPVSGYMTVSAEERVQAPHETAWISALTAAGFPDGDLDGLQQLAVKLEDFPVDEMVCLAQALRELRSSDASQLADAGLNVSARNLMGSAKVLAQLPSKALMTLGLPARLQRSSPRYVVCAGPSHPVATLLIENPRAFENAVRAGLDHSVALVCTYGFGLSYLTEELVETLTQPGGDHPIMLTRAGAPPSLEVLLAASEIYLWADFDRVAFAIYATLRRAIPRLALSGLYRVMDEMLDNPMTSHPYASLFDKAGQPLRPVGPPSDPIVRRLWERCVMRAVDQEAVCEADILRLGSCSIDVACQGEV